MTYTVDEFLNGRVTLFGGDNREILIDAPDDSIDAVLTDGPYNLSSIVKRFGGPNAAPAKGNEAYMRASKGFMNRSWDSGEVVNDYKFWAECLRVLKPGGHLLSFGGTRTYHRMACAVEDAGFEIRDMIQWLYGSGFPKSHDVSKGIDKAAGVERAVTREASVQDNERPDHIDMDPRSSSDRERRDTPATLAAQEWEGWGTALKPANEPIVLARKPLSEKTVAANVLKWGTGAINIDGCRVEAPEGKTKGGRGASNGAIGWQPAADFDETKGRFPANVITDGSDEVVSAFPHTKSGALTGQPRKGGNNVYGQPGATEGTPRYSEASEGSAARFFYQAKANKTDRANSKHPTVKPVALMRYLARLITPPGGTILDPFAGSGTTGEAAYLEGFNCYLMERETEYQADIAARFNAMARLSDGAIYAAVSAADNDNQIDLEEAIALAALAA